MSIQINITDEDTIDKISAKIENNQELIMDIKSAAKVVKEELKKIEASVGEWHEKREVVFNNLKSSWKEQYGKTVNELKGSTISKDVVAGLKDFEKFSNKQVALNIKNLLVINAEYSAKTKELSKGLGELASPHLKAVKSPAFGTGVKAVNAVEKELQNYIKNECFEEFDIYSLSSQLNKKLIAATKGMSDEKDHKKYMAQVELFATTMLGSLVEPLDLSKVTKKSLKDNTLLSTMLYEVEVNISFQKIGQALDDLKILNNSVHLDALVDSYGVAPDEASMKRSKLAMKGVKESFAHFKRDFEERVLEDVGTNSLNNMYLGDMMDHLNLGKACLVNNAPLMDEYSNMDTASRELISDSLYEYLNSEKFSEELDAQKKEKKSKKMKP